MEIICMGKVKWHFFFRFHSKLHKPNPIAVISNSKCHWILAWIWSMFFFYFFFFFHLIYIPWVNVLFVFETKRTPVYTSNFFFLLVLFLEYLMKSFGFDFIAIDPQLTQTLR